MKVPFSYLERQFEETEPYLDRIGELAREGKFTLGEPVERFEEQFASHCDTEHAVGVASGTDALILSLKLLDVGPGDEVITTPMTFIATVGAISMTGAEPVFVDSREGFVIDESQIEEAITDDTAAILPVHYTGNVPDMNRIQEIANKHDLHIIEDACQAIGARRNDKPVGRWGDTACYSLHPLKNLNVWGDGGIITTDSDDLAEELRLLRNHGLKNRDEVSQFGHNSRLHTVQAAVGNILIDDLDWITERRREIASRYDDLLKPIDGVTVPQRNESVKHVFHLYMIRVERRDELQTYLRENGVEAKVHYPIPVHLQEPGRELGYGSGDFPFCESDCDQIISLPAHQHLTDEEINYTISQIRSFYGENKQ